MQTKEFLRRLDDARIVAAIAAAERTTSGEIRVYIHDEEVSGDALPCAEQKFLQLGMNKTAERNAILILVAPQSQKFAVVGDEGVHRKCGTAFWQQLVDMMREHFKREEFTDAIVEAVDCAGKFLAQHFPRRGDDQNELPDAVVRS